MAVFLKVCMLFLMRDNSDVYTSRVLKFIGTFVASFEEEVEADGSNHPIITHTFKEILSVSLHWALL
jgi:hypothetical protein